MKEALESWAFLVGIRLMEGPQALVRRGAHRVRRVLREDRGQTPTEYLMIVGLMAAVIVVAFTMMFWPGVRGAVSSWYQKVATAITGDDITP
jgi:Flp pilus assembly pilin Flp